METVVEQKGTGRPWAIDDEKEQKMIAAFEQDCTIEEACAYAKVSEAAFYRRQAADSAFRERILQAKQMAFIIAKNAVVKSMKSGNGKIALDFLKARQPSLYAERQEHDHYAGRSLSELRSREEYLRQRITALEGGAGSKSLHSGEVIDGIPSEENAGAQEATGAHHVRPASEGIPGREPYGEDGVEHARSEPVRAQGTPEDPIQ